MGREEFSLKIPQGNRSRPSVLPFALMFIFIVMIIIGSYQGSFSGLKEDEGPLIFNNVTNMDFSNDTLFLASPDNDLKVCVWTTELGDEKGCPVYSILYNGDPVVQRSRLGLNIEGMEEKLSSGLMLDGNERSSVNSSIELVASDVDVIPERYNQMIVSYSSTEEEEIGMDIIFRAYDEGISFSYYVDKLDGKKTCRIKDEITSFNVTEDSICFAEYGVEAAYNKVKVSEIKKDCELPLLIEDADSECWMTISEAGLQDYSRAFLGPGSKMNGTIDTSIYSSVGKNVPFTTPWRMVLIGDHPFEMIEKGRICYSMCSDNVIGDTSWIMPGKAFRDCSLTTKGSKGIIDYCSYHGMEYVHLDAGWYGKESESSSDASTVSAKNLNLTEVISYAKSKDIGVILYVNNKALTRQYKDIFPLYKKWGIAGVKFGFVDGRSQAGINFVHKAVQEAAKNELIVDVHDYYRPTGMSRTYPNLLTQEGVRGNEQFPSARDNTILPFTRCVAGPTDYTPIFATKGTTTTMAHQLALPIVIFSPLQYIYWYGTPEKAGNSSINTLWDNIPTVWNESIFIEGNPGSHAVYARRSDKDWYLGAINGPKDRTLKIRLDFLDQGDQYSARLYTDPGNGSVEIRDFTVNSETEIIENVPQRSGLSMKIKEVQEDPPPDDDKYPPRLVDIGKWEIFEDTVQKVTLLSPNGWDGLTIKHDPLPGFLHLLEGDKALLAEPGNDDVGDHSVVFELFSGEELLDSIEMVIEVQNVNDPPEMTIPEYVMMDTGTRYVIPLKATDIDPTEDDLIWEINTNADFFDLDEENDTLNAYPTLLDGGMHTIYLNVSDGNGGSVEGKMYALVTQPNGSVFLLPSNGSLELREGQYFTYRFQAISEGKNVENLIWKLKNAPSFLSIDEDSGILSGRSGNKDAGVYMFDVTLEEGGVETASATFTVFVHRVNDPPMITTSPTLIEVDAGSTLQVELDAIDEDLISGSLKWSMVESPDFAIVETETGKLLISPGEDERGFHEVLVRVEDPEGAFDDLVLAVLVNGDESGKDIEEWEYNGSKVRVIPVEITSDVWNEYPYYVVDGSSIIIYYPFMEESIEDPGDGSDIGYIALFVILVSVITIFIHMFIKR